METKQETGNNKKETQTLQKMNRQWEMGGPREGHQPEHPKAKPVICVNEAGSVRNFT